MTIKECLKSKMFRDYLAGAQRGDWAPTLVILDGKKRSKPMITVLEEEAADNRVKLAEHALRQGATAVIMVSEVWLSKTAGKTGIRPSKSADKKSAVSVIVFKLDGDKVVEAGFTSIHPMAKGASIGA